MVPSDSNIAPTPRSRGEGRIRVQDPTLKMATSRIEVSFNWIARVRDVSDLAELLFPGNHNQQHAFLAIWLTLKWSDHRMVPNLGDVAREHGISKRTLERVRAKMRRMGLIDHVSRFGARHGYREGWVLSPRFENSLRQLATKVVELKDTSRCSKEKDVLLLEFAAARREAAGQRCGQADEERPPDEEGSAE